MRHWRLFLVVAVSAIVLVFVVPTIVAVFLFGACDEKALASAESPNSSRRATLIRRECNVTTRPMMLVVVSKRYPLVGFRGGQDVLAMDTMENPTVVRLQWEDEATLTIEGTSRGRVIWREEKAGPISVQYR